MRKNRLLISYAVLFLCILTSWILYALFGPALIDGLYTSEWMGIIQKTMRNGTVIPLEDYIQAADRLMVVGTAWVLALLLALAILVKNPIGTFLLCGSCFFCFSLMFVLLELFPFLIDSVPLDFIDYFAYKKNYVADTRLVYREKPFVSTTFDDFRGSRYSPVYKIEVTPTTIKWATDENGFRRNGEAPKNADIIIVGDSFIEYGDNEADTFGKRLEKKLSGLTVTNLGKAGYGPFQYFEVFRRYGLAKNPKYALFCFFEGNDLSDIRQYMEWKKGEGKGDYRKIYTALTEDFFQRHIIALTGAVHYLKTQINSLIGIILGEIRDIRGYNHPYVSVLNVSGKSYKMLFGFDVKHAQSKEELFNSKEVRELIGILRDFRDTSEQRNIIPLILSIPNQASIYVEYATEESGTMARRLNNKQKRTAKNLEDAVLRILQELNLEVINLSTVFRQAANDGKVLYYALDSHWNAEGREVAATFVAETLKHRYMPLSEGERKKDGAVGKY